MTDLFQGTKNQLIEKGWCQGSYRQRDGKMCLRGAMDIASGVFTPNPDGGHMKYNAAATPEQAAVLLRGDAIITALVNQAAPDVQQGILAATDFDLRQGDSGGELRTGAGSVGYGVHYFSEGEAIEKWNDATNYDVATGNDVSARTIEDITTLLDKASAEYGHLVQLPEPVATP